ncbi:MAG TPA: sugar ABC transporter permease [Candidatus Hydrogenedentes bacterium]|nr:sugar ABC transporter permease [Candidatus Hydrogenedentota bacterium]
MNANLRTATVALCFLLPNFAGFLVFTLGPVLFSLGASFTNWNLMRTVPFHVVGLENYFALVQDPQFWLYFVNTIYFMIGIPVSIAGSLFLAVLLSQKLRGMTIYRTLFYLPSFTAGVALFILWKQLYNPEFGPINTALRHVFDVFGAPGVELPKWLLSTENLLGLAPERVHISARDFGVGAREAIIIMGIWIAIGGSNMLLYLAGISNIPPELYEAADIDGANAWRKFWNVTWPQLAPTTFFIVIMSFIGGLQGGFEQARVMTNGGPGGTTTTLAFYIYNKAFVEFQIGYASAIAWVLFAFIFAITLVNWRFGSRYVNY